MPTLQRDPATLCRATFFTPCASEPEQRDDAELARPLIVDGDRALIKTDLLIESFLALLATRPVKALRCLGGLGSGRAALAARLADEVTIPPHTLPLNQQLLERLREKKVAGRRLYLVSAADRRLIEALAAHLGLFDGTFVFDGETDPAGVARMRRLCEAFGEGGFDDADYVTADAKTTGLVQAVPWGEVMKVLRIHQWLKNTLLFLPLFAAHVGDVASIATSVLAFFCFNFCASSVYVLNDLLDLSNDRQHPSKSRRPFAAGSIDLRIGIVLIPLLLALSAGLAVFLPRAFIEVLVVYYVLTLSYSLWLKRMMIVDVVLLACLYGIRVVAGAVAVGITLSVWLVAFCLFLFFCLAMVKRCSELINCGGREAVQLPGRAYLPNDLPVLESMAIASGYISVLVLALYINSPIAHQLYKIPELLWIFCIVLLYWISRVLVLTRRGLMHDDPIIFAATDRISLLCGAVMGAVAIGTSL